MTCKINMVNSLIKRAVAVGVTVFLLFLFSGLSWGDTTFFIEHSETDGSLAISKLTPTGLNLVEQDNGVTIPNSCQPPEVSWDSSDGALILSGYGDHKKLSWTGTINAEGKFTSSMSSNFQPISCTAVTAFSATVNFPEVVPCTSYGDWSGCDGGIKTRTATPAKCQPQPNQPLVISCNIPCTEWNYGNWVPADAACTPGAQRTRTYAATPPGCVGSVGTAPDSIGVCAVPQCTGYNYACSGACTNGSCTATVLSTIPAVCNGGAQPQSTTSCTSTPCSGYTYNQYGVCSADGIQTRTVSGYLPTGCTGAPSSDPVLSQTCSPGGGTGDYQPLNMNCGSDAAITSVSNGTYLYEFTVPKGTYNNVVVATQQLLTMVNGVNIAWSEQIVVMKGGNITADNYNSLMTQVKAGTSNAMISTGAGGLYYTLSKSGNTLGQNLLIRSSPDGEITYSSTTKKITFENAVRFTMVLSAGDVGVNKVPAGAKHKLRYCYQ